MKTKTWILLISLFSLVCLALTAVFFLGAAAKNSAEVYSDGSLIMTLDLSKDGEYTVAYGEDWNTLIVQNGKVSVSSASCPSQDCVQHGAANSGAPIVCLPNRLVIQFTDQNALDALVG